MMKMYQNRVVYLSLPGTVKGFTVLDSEDFCTIVLNKNLSYEQNVKSYLHEMKHISVDDFYNIEDVDFIERRSHG